MSRDYVNIERTNNIKPVCASVESLDKRYFFDTDTGIPFQRITAQTKLRVGCLYDFTYKLNEDDCSCEGNTYTYLVIKAEPSNVYYIAEYCNNKIYRTEWSRLSPEFYQRCHAKDVLGFDLNTFKYESEREPKIVELPSVNIGDTIYIKCLNGYEECTVTGLIYTEKGWRINVNHYALWDSPFVCEEGETWVRTRAEAIEKFASDVNLPFSEEEKEKLEEMIDEAINDECRYNKGNITSEAWDFFENSASAIVLNKIANALINEDIETFDEITIETVDEYLQDAIHEYEKKHGFIRDYAGE